MKTRRRYTAEDVLGELWTSTKTALYVTAIGVGFVLTLLALCPQLVLAESTRTAGHIRFSESGEDPRETIFGKPTKVVDGDTIIVNGIAIDLYGVDALEREQICIEERFDTKTNTVVDVDFDCGGMAAHFLSRLLRKRPLLTCRIVPHDDDSPNVLAQCHGGTKLTDHSDVAFQVVEHGAALADTSHPEVYNRGDSPGIREYLSMEQSADARNRGLWGMQFSLPWEWRKGSRELVKGLSPYDNPPKRLDPCPVKAYMFEGKHYYDSHESPRYDFVGEKLIVEGNGGCYATEIEARLSGYVRDTRYPYIQDMTEKEHQRFLESRKPSPSVSKKKPELMEKFEKTVARQKKYRP